MVIAEHPRGLEDFFYEKIKRLECGMVECEVVVFIDNWNFACSDLIRALPQTQRHGSRHWAGLLIPPIKAAFSWAWKIP